MRLDPDHVRKLAKAIKRSPPPEVNLDIAFMRAAMDRLSLWERGLFMDALMRAAGARRPPGQVLRSARAGDAPGHRAGGLQPR